MEFSIAMRRMGVLGVTLLLFLAAVGPACLATASVAMGMPMDSPATAPMDCDSEGSGSMSACPHIDPVEFTADSSRAETVQFVAVVMPVTEPTPATVPVGRIIVRAERIVSPPPSHITPLRL